MRKQAITTEERDEKKTDHDGIEIQGAKQEDKNELEGTLSEASSVNASIRSKDADSGSEVSSDEDATQQHDRDVCKETGFEPKKKKKKKRKKKKKGKKGAVKTQEPLSTEEVTSIPQEERVKKTDGHEKDGLPGTSHPEEENEGGKELLKQTNQQENLFTKTTPSETALGTKSKQENKTPSTRCQKSVETGSANVEKRKPKDVLARDEEGNMSAPGDVQVDINSCMDKEQTDTEGKSSTKDQRMAVGVQNQNRVETEAPNDGEKSIDGNEASSRHAAIAGKEEQNVTPERAKPNVAASDGDNGDLNGNVDAQETSQEERGGASSEGIMAADRRRADNENTPNPNTVRCETSVSRL